jgi:outer membrane protein OmpA-like peptidoglycan-associated protein
VFEPALRSPLRRGLLAAVLVAGLAGCARQVDAPPTAVVFFNAWSSELDGTAQGVINEFAKDARAAPGRQIQVRGYADQAGSAQANRVLSQLRAQVVTDALTAQGIAPSRIVQVARGATGTDPGIESRRVDLQLAPAS